MAIPARSAAASTEHEPSVEELKEAGRRRKARPGLTPEEIADLEATYKDVATATDDDAKQLRRAIVAKLRRTTHEEFHPECTAKVEITVRAHPAFGGPYLINEEPYLGKRKVWPCEARQLASMMQDAETVEANRLKSGGRIVDLDNPVADRIRQIPQPWDQ